MSFKLELSDNTIFKEAFESITAIVDEVICVVDSEGFRINAIDRSHIVFVTLDLQPTVFDEFECMEPERITIDTSEFMKILKRMNKQDTLTLCNDEGNLIIKLTGDVDREFKIRLIDSDYETPQPPTLEPPCRIEVESGLIKDCITDMELFSETLYFQIDEDYLKVATDGEFGDAEVKYLHGADIYEVVESTFSIEKLKQMFKACKFSDNVELALGNDMPLILNFILPGDDGKLGFLLAPRIETDE